MDKGNIQLDEGGGGMKLENRRLRRDQTGAVARWGGQSVDWKTVVVGERGV